MKKFFALLLICLLVLSGTASAVVYKWGDNDLYESLRNVFSTGSNGHNHDGTNSRLITALGAVTSGSINGVVIGGSVAAAGTFTSITAATISSTTSSTSPLYIVLRYLRLMYFSKLTRPASGAEAGSMIVMKGANSGDCGIDNTGANTVMVACVSDGTNWKAV